MAGPPAVLNFRKLNKKLLVWHLIGNLVPMGPFKHLVLSLTAFVHVEYDV